ncbi:MAG: ATP-binding cassette domain-containing protein [Gammaproteobacteria bacterium]
MIGVQQLAKRFGTVEAVREVSFEAPDGRITGLLGPNGAGKSTTLRLLYGALAADRGEARIDGLLAGPNRPEARRQLGVLPHGAGLYPHLTARENIRYFGQLHGLRGAALESRIAELVELLGLGEVAERKTQGFSQGQKVKVGIARALVHSPRNVVLDEPTNGLDVMAIRSLREVLRGLRAAGHCVLFSSHVMQEVAALCDEVVIIAGGRVVARGTPDQLRGQAGTVTLEDAFVHLLGDAPAGELP